MASAAVDTLNRSSRTLANIRAFASKSPDEAEAYFRKLKANLDAAGAERAATTIGALLKGEGKLVERVTAAEKDLKLLFPEQASEWGALQAKRTATIGWSTAVAEKPLHLTGELLLENPLRFRHQGREYLLADSRRKPSVGTFPMSLITGLGKGDGPITVQGSLSADGTTFILQGFALNLGGKFDTLLAGRVEVVDDEVVLASTLGDVKITHPELKKRLKSLPTLATILPGEPSGSPGKLTYELNPNELFALGRFRDLDTHGDERWVSSDMATSHFERQPVRLGPNVAVERVNHEDRVWFYGMVTVGPEGVGESFDASYVGNAGMGELQFAPTLPTADAVQAAVLLTQA